jgi:hypothetical protein
MAIKFLNHLDLTQNEIQNTALHNTEATDITTPVSGQIIFDNGTGVNKLKYYDGSAWISLTSATDTLQAISSDSSNADRYITTVANSTGAQEGLSHSTLTYNPSTETLNVTNLVVAGTSTTINTEEINLADNIIILNSNYEDSSPTENAGIEVERGTADDNVSLVWNETSDRWTFTNDGTTFYNIPISSEYDNFNFNVQVGATSQEVSDGGTVTFAQGGGLTVGISADDTITYTHADTSSQASVDNSGRTYIQDITLDTYGHITGITSATETVTDTQLATKEADIDVSDTTFIANKRATINHALNSENIIVQMYDKTTGAVVHADVEHTSDGSTISKNHVRIEFGVVPDNDIRVIMIDAKDAATSVTPSYS